MSSTRNFTEIQWHTGDLSDIYGYYSMWENGYVSISIIKNLSSLQNEEMIVRIAENRNYIEISFLNVNKQIYPLMYFLIEHFFTWVYLVPPSSRAVGQISHQHSSPCLGDEQQQLLSFQPLSCSMLLELPAPIPYPMHWLLHPVVRS